MKWSRGLDPDIHVVAQYHIIDDEGDGIVQEKATDAIQLQVVDGGSMPRFWTCIRCALI